MPGKKERKKERKKEKEGKGFCLVEVNVTTKWFLCKRLMIGL
jgi:hypothetical protein